MSMEVNSCIRTVFVVGMCVSTKVNSCIRTVFDV